MVWQPSTRSQAFTGWHTGTGGKGFTASHALTGLHTPGVASATLFQPKASTANAIAGPIQLLVRLIEVLLLKKGGYSQQTGRPDIGRHTSRLPAVSSLWHLGLPLSSHYIGIITTSLIVFEMYVSRWVASE